MPEDPKLAVTPPEKVDPKVEAKVAKIQSEPSEVLSEGSTDGLEQDDTADEAAAERAAKTERKGYTGHAKGLGLLSGKHYLVATSNANQNVTGKLIRTSDLGVLLKRDRATSEDPSFFPWHNVVALHRATEAETGIPENDDD